MKKYIYKLFAISTILFLGASCTNDAVLTSLKEVSFSGALVASPSTIVLSATTSAQPVVAFSWPAVVFPIQAPVSYALEFDIPSDVSGSTAWAKALRVEVGEDVLSKSLLGDDLNKMAIKLGLPVDVAGKIVVRVESYLDRKIYSDPITITVTPYAKPVVFGEIYMPGAYQDWIIGTAAALKAVDSGIYQGYVTFPATKGLGFKFTNERNWNQFYGADANGNILEGSDTDFAIAQAGTYQMTVNLNTSKWTAVAFSWGIIGTATPGGWDNSTNMSYDHQLNVWKYTGALTAGALKFRLNNAWTINYGPKNNTEGKTYLDDPGAHEITEAGNYEVTFSIAEKNPTTGVYPATATYTIKKI